MLKDTTIDNIVFGGPAWNAKGQIRLGDIIIKVPAALAPHRATLPISHGKLSPYPTRNSYSNPGYSREPRTLPEGEGEGSEKGREEGREEGEKRH